MQLETLKAFCDLVESTQLNQLLGAIDRIRSKQRRSFPEIDRVAYFALPAATTKLIEYQRPFLHELAARLVAGSLTTPA